MRLLLLIRLGDAQQEISPLPSMAKGRRAETQAEGTRTPTPEAADRACESATPPSILVAETGCIGRGEH